MGSNLCAENSVIGHKGAKDRERYRNYGKNLVMVYVMVTASLLLGQYVLKNHQINQFTLAIPADNCKQ